MKLLVSSIAVAIKPPKVELSFGEILLSIVGLIVSTIVAYMLLRIQLRDPKPRVAITGNSIVSAVEGDDIEILYLGKKVPQVTRTFAIFWNAGRGSIRGKDDLALPVSFAIEDGDVLLNRIVGVSRHSILPEIFQSDGRSTIDFHHLDHGDGLVVELVHTGPNPIKVDVRGDVVGARGGIRKFEVRRASQPKFITIGLGFFGLAAIVFGSDVPSRFVGIAMILIATFDLWSNGSRRLPRGLGPLNLPRVASGNRWNRKHQWVPPESH